MLTHLFFCRVHLAINPDLVFFSSPEVLFGFFIFLFYTSLIDVFGVQHMKYRYKNFLNPLLVLSSVSVLDLFLFIFLVIMGQIFLVLCIPNF